MISTGEFKTVEINNITCIDVNGQYVSDTTNYILIIDIINLNSATNSSISNIFIQSSTANLLKMQSVVGSTVTPVYMNFQNITYRDSYIKLKQSFIIFSNVESQEQFYTVFDLVTFNNLTFRSGGYLMDFGHQTLTQVVVSNLVFTNVFAGTIHLEASYKVLPYKTNVLVQNGKFENVNSNTESIFLLNEGANLEIRNSSFNQISCTETGGVIYSSYQFTITNIYDSSFTNSSAVKASLFLIEDGGVIRLYRWSMIQNFAVTSTLLQASNNGYFEIYNSKITQNYGMLNIVLEIINSINLSIIDNTKIYSNEFMTISDIYSEFTDSCKLLWFVPTSLASYIISNPSLYNFLIEPKMFELISANLIIQNNSVIYNQLSIAKSFMSTLTFVDSKFYNLMISEKGMRIAESTFNITNCIFYNISASDTTSFVDAGINTIAYMINITYSNWSWPFIVTSVAKVTLDRVSISNWYPHLEWVSILRAPYVSISNSSMSFAYSDNSTSPFRILDSKVDLIENTSISNMNQYAIYISLWNVTSIDGLHISSTYGIYSKNSNINKIANSIFENNGKGYNNLGQLSTQGGAILFINTNFTIESSQFYNNTSKYGAGIYVSCQLSPICVTSISNTTFEQNIAQLSGGGIMYDLYRPKLSNLVFKSNIALYGPNIGSYAVKVDIQNITITAININNAVSGQIAQTYVLSVVDYDDQVMNIDPNLKVTIKAVTPGASIFGRNIYFADAGVAKMNETILISTPGSTNIVFSIVPNTIDLDKARAVYGSNYTLPNIIANFRYCKPGEYFFANQWLSWSQGSYSLFWNSTLCSQWMTNVNCVGDEVINVNAGFWRKSTNSTLIVEWPNKNACNGGYNTTNTYPVNWATGYKGVLCAKWMKVGQDNYEKVSNFQCTKCASLLVIYIRMVGMAVAFIFVILFIVYLKRKEGNERTVLMRIMANYIQIMTTTLAYNMNLPTTISDIFTPLKAVGSGTTTVFSMDWFSSTSEFKLFTPSSTVFKMFMMAITPMLLWGIISIILCTVALITRASLKDFK